MISIKECVASLMRTTFNATAKVEPELINRRASYVRRYFAGYPHVMIWNPSAEDYRTVYATADHINRWCLDNCQGRFTNQIHRVVWDEWQNDWAMNDIGGTDVWFWAFELEEDAIMFSLRW